MSESSPNTPKPKKSVALSGVPAGNTALCTVGLTGNDLHYRGYDILDFAEIAEFEEIAFLLVHGRLPSPSEFVAYKRKLKALRGLPASVQDILECIPANTHPGMTRVAASERIRLLSHGLAYYARIALLSAGTQWPWAAVPALSHRVLVRTDGESERRHDHGPFGTCSLSHSAHKCLSAPVNEP